MNMVMNFWVCTYGSNLCRTCSHSVTSWRSLVCFSGIWIWRMLTYLLTYLLTPWCRVLLEKLTGLQLVKKLPAFHRTPRFITAITSVRHLSVSWASPIPVHIPTSRLLEIHPNIHPSTPRSPQWSLSLRFPHQDPIHPPLLIIS